MGRRALLEAARIEAEHDRRRRELVRRELSNLATPPRHDDSTPPR
jgi:hypothetical protein